MRTDQDVVFELWCRLTGQESGEFGPHERAAFVARPQIAALSTVPYPTLLDAGVRSASRGSLPLEGWLATVRRLQSADGPAGPDRDESPDSTSPWRASRTDSNWSWPGLDR